MSENCDKIGTFCGNNCADIISCTQIGGSQSNLPCKEISEHQYCIENSDNTASCSADSIECKGIGSSVRILCGQFGEYPHPLDCTKTVRCKDVNEEAFETCHCSGDDIIDINAANLPCISSPPPATTTTTTTVITTTSATTNVADLIEKALPDDCKLTYSERCPSVGTSFTIGAYHYICIDEQGIMVYSGSKARLHSSIVTREHEKLCEPSPSSPTSNKRNFYTRLH